MKNGSRFSGEELIFFSFFFSSDKRKKEKLHHTHTLTVFSQVIILSLNLANCSGQL